MNIVTVEGIIGAGKTRLLHEVTDQVPPDAQILFEPVEGFCKYGKFNPLQLAFEQNGKNCAMCQLHFIETLEEFYRYKKENVPLTFWVTERNLYSPMVFINALLKANYLSEFCACKLGDATNKALKAIFPEHPFGADKIFFIDCPVEIAFKRIKDRERVEETKVNEAEFYNYLLHLDRSYKEYLEYYKHNRGAANLCIVSYDDAFLHRKFLNFLYLPRIEGYDETDGVINP